MDKFLLKVRIVPRWIIIIIDLIILLFSSLLAFLLRFNFNYSRLDSFEVNKGILLFTFFCFSSSIITRSYAGIVRYTGTQDAGRILGTVLMGSVLTAITSTAYFSIYGKYLIPFSVIVNQRCYRRRELRIIAQYTKTRGKTKKMLNKQGK
jgi:FlaA1/EpsC-like NDP-sugar epimerase